MPSASNGKDGKNTYSFLTAGFTMPAVNANVTVTVQNTGQFTNQWAGVGGVLYIPTAGYFLVIGITGTNQITLQNLGYPSNAAPTTSIVSGLLVQVAGIRGETGTGTVGADGTTNLHTVVNITKTATISTEVTMDTYSLPANTLVNDGDSLVINGMVLLDQAPPLAGFNLVRVSFASNSLFFVQDPNPIFHWFVLFNPLVNSSFEIRVIKTSATTASVVLKNRSNSGANTLADYYGTLTGLDFTIINAITTSIFQVDPSSIFINAITIDKISAS